MLFLNNKFRKQAMKTIKSKHKEAKKVILNNQQHQNQSHNLYSSKQISTHDKTSTNCTISSLLLINNPNKKTTKNKKNKNSTHIANVLDISRGLPTSKSTKKLKVPSLMMQKNQEIVNFDQESFRQYYLINDTFVPITKADQKNTIQSFFSKTASTSTEFNHFKTPPKSCHFQQNFKINLRKRSIRSNYNKSQSLTQLNNKSQSKISSEKSQAGFCSTNTPVVAESHEMGIQYLQRKQELALNKVQQGIQAILEESPISKIQQDKENVSDILFKLQFSHLSNEKSFTNLSTHEKEHFSQLLETLLEKLKPRKPPVLVPINLKEAAEDEETKVQSVDQLSKLMDYSNLQHLIKLREYRQMSWMDVQQTQSVDVVDTSILAVISILCNLFCYIEMQETQGFLFSIRRIYGLSYRQKYKNISRSIPLRSDKEFKILDENVYINFLNESGISNVYEAIHIRAIFDAFNEYLEQYRPFYSGNGEPFPWSFKMFAALSQYSIDEESFQIVFRQAKQTIVEWCSNLCGLQVQHTYKDLSADNPLQDKLATNEKKLLSGWIREQRFEKDEIQIESTKLLNEIEEILYNQLLEELLLQFNQFT